MQRELDFDKSEFTKIKKQWGDKNIKNYKYTHEYTDVIDKKTKRNVYTISKGKCVSADYYVKNEDTGNFDFKETKKSDGMTLKYSFDDIFDRIESDYNKYQRLNFEKEKIAYVNIKVLYNKKYSYPKIYDFIIYYDDDVEVTYDGSIPTVTYTSPADYNFNVINVVDFEVIEDETKEDAATEQQNATEQSDGENETVNVPAGPGNTEIGETEGEEEGSGAGAGSNGSTETGTPESAEG